MSPAAAPLLSADEPPAYRVIEGAGASPFLITCDHAGNRLPRALGDLGLSPAELATHIAWDIGAAGVAEELGRRLGAFVILQTYSRLAIDCNRPLDQKSSIVDRSESTDVPGNRGLARADADARADAIFRPYHARIVAELDRRRRESVPTILIAMHSFTPRFLGRDRPWHAGVLYNRDTRLARIMLELLHREPGLVIGDNEPYSVSDATDYGVVQYGELLGHPHVEIEVRQDLIAEPAGQLAWGERLARLLVRARPLLGV